MIVFRIQKQKGKKALVLRDSECKDGELGRDGELASETKTKPIHSLQLYRTFYFFSAFHFLLTRNTGTL